ncbi:receptor like protein kinase S.2-like [Phragmites australis]|uniref:receptor like protein kinase S.2-like n=1 Tax=Phragmites australis TaxID=29695 RepID=UPI002D76BBB4|nr:receptor like protein kinase S.2-like [Phragmites australis]
MENESQHASVTPRDLTFKLLEDITNKFCEEQKVGSGGYGEVYKGVLHNGEEIAVKKLYPTQGLDDAGFEKEFNNLMRVQHHNIIRLVGYCYEIRHTPIEVKGKYHFAQIEERALCFEYLKHGSLDKHLSDETCGLDWHIRYKIIKGICEGLNYLHNGSKDNHMYHLDLKPANILLDENMVPKIADFGLSRLFGTTQTHITKNFAGTLGYVPPEYINKRQISKKYDVFSLGVIIIKIMTGPLGYSNSAEMSSQQFIELVHDNWKNRLQATSRHTSQEADSLEVKTCIEMALRCVEPDPMRRPTILEVVDKLNEIETLKLSLVSQSSDPKERVEINPVELRFPFELNKEISCVLQLMNKSDDFIAFSAKTNKSKYYTRPDKGIMPPWSKHYVVTTMRAQERSPIDMQCNDIFVVQSTSVSEGVTPSDITEQLFEKMVGKLVHEVTLPIVYVALPQPPQTRGEGSQALLPAPSLPALLRKGPRDTKPDKSFWLDSTIGAKCYMLSSRYLRITWGETPGHWKWISLPDSRFSECAELLNVYFLAVIGEIPTEDLSAGTSYAVYLVYKLASGAAGLKGGQKSSIRLHGERIVATSRVNVDPAAVQAAGVAFPVTRSDGWMEVKLAEFVADEQMLNEKAVIVDFCEENDHIKKSGIIIEGMEFRPSY